MGTFSSGGSSRARRVPDSPHSARCATEGSQDKRVWFSTALAREVYRSPVQEDVRDDAQPTRRQRPQPATSDPTAPETASRGDSQASANVLGEAIAEVQRVIVGQEHMVEQLMVALLAKGHALLEGVPGTAKTLAVRTFADVVGGDFSRIQFTPDLVPSDIVGTRIYPRSRRRPDTALGPVFANFVLADEINRAPAKVRSVGDAGAMAERQVSLAAAATSVPKPFIVIATQNPDRVRGGTRRREAQRDRFLLKVDVPYPYGNEESGDPSKPDERPAAEVSGSILKPRMERSRWLWVSCTFVHWAWKQRVRCSGRHVTSGAEARSGRSRVDHLSAFAVRYYVRPGRVSCVEKIHGRTHVLLTDVQVVVMDDGPLFKELDG